MFISLSNDVRYLLKPVSRLNLAVSLPVSEMFPKVPRLRYRDICRLLLSFCYLTAPVLHLSCTLVLWRGSQAATALPFQIRYETYAALTKWENDAPKAKPATE